MRARLRTPARYHRVASEYFDQVAVQLGQQIQSETLTEDEIQSMSIDDVRARLIETSKGAARARKTGHVGLQEEAKVERDRLLNRLRGLPALSKIPKPSSDYFHLNDRLSVAVDDHRTPVLAEELVLLVADAYKDSDREVAQRLVENLVDAYPGVESLEALTATLADDTIAEPARANQIDAARANAQEKLTNLEMLLQREARIRRVLDERLWSHLTPAPTADAPVILVSVLVTDVSEETLVALLEVGLAIEGQSRHPAVVVGKIPPDRLRDLALLETVRRVQPAEMVPEETKN
ncbi:MAG: hypothetical protein HKO59_03190 [Phycisphaerales bacterium]|nr:hypothetical protein [Phycisphaerales bacterium]